MMVDKLLGFTFFVIMGVVFFVLGRDYLHRGYQEDELFLGNTVSSMLVVFAAMDEALGVFMCIVGFVYLLQ